MFRRSRLCVLHRVARKAPLGIASCLVIRDVCWEQRVTRHVQDARKMGEMEMRNIDNFGHSLPKDASDIAPNAGAFDAIIIRSLTIKSVDDGKKKKKEKEQNRERERERGEGRGSAMRLSDLIYEAI